MNANKNLLNNEDFKMAKNLSKQQSISDFGNVEQFKDPNATPKYQEVKWNETAKKFESGKDKKGKFTDTKEDTETLTKEYNSETEADQWDKQLKQQQSMAENALNGDEYNRELEKQVLSSKQGKSLENEIINRNNENLSKLNQEVSKEYTGKLPEDGFSNNELFDSINSWKTSDNTKGDAVESFKNNNSKYTSAKSSISTANSVLIACNKMESDLTGQIKTLIDKKNRTSSDNKKLIELQNQRADNLKALENWNKILKNAQVQIKAMDEACESYANGGQPVLNETEKEQEITTVPPEAQKATDINETVSGEETKEPEAPVTPSTPMLDTVSKDKLVKGIENINSAKFNDLVKDVATMMGYQNVTDSASLYEPASSKDIISKLKEKGWNDEMLGAFITKLADSDTSGKWNVTNSYWKPYYDKFVEYTKTNTKTDTSSLPEVAKYEPINEEGEPVFTFTDAAKNGVTKGVNFTPVGDTEKLDNYIEKGEIISPEKADALAKSEVTVTPDEVSNAEAEVVKELKDAGFTDEQIKNDPNVKKYAKATAEANKAQTEFDEAVTNRDKVKAELEADDDKRKNFNAYKEQADELKKQFEDKKNLSPKELFETFGTKSQKAAIDGTLTLNENQYNCILNSRITGKESLLNILEKGDDGLYHVKSDDKTPLSLLVELGTIAEDTENKTKIDNDTLAKVNSAMAIATGNGSSVTKEEFFMGPINAKLAELEAEVKSAKPMSDEERAIKEKELATYEAIVQAKYNAVNTFVSNKNRWLEGRTELRAITYPELQTISSAYVNGKFGEVGSKEAKRTVARLIANEIGTSLTELAAFIKTGASIDNKSLWEKIQDGTLQADLNAYNLATSGTTQGVLQEYGRIGNKTEELNDTILRTQLGNVDKAFGLHWDRATKEYNMDTVKKLVDKYQKLGLNGQDALQVAMAVQIANGGAPGPLQALITQYGGKILGIIEGDTKESVINGIKFSSKDTPKEFVEKLGLPEEITSDEDYKKFEEAEESLTKFITDNYKNEKDIPISINFEDQFIQTQKKAWEKKQEKAKKEAGKEADKEAKEQGKAEKKAEKIETAKTKLNDKFVNIANNPNAEINSKDIKELVQDYYNKVGHDWSKVTELLEDNGLTADVTFNDKKDKIKTINVYRKDTSSTENKDMSSVVSFMDRIRSGDESALDDYNTYNA